jgi:D-sedoheptulose 7-phosphate isomerase
MDSVARTLREIAENLQAIGGGDYPQTVERAIDLLETAFREGRTLFVFGNGGSAADAQHICAELVGRFLIERRPLSAVALTSNQALLTAWSNDHRFDDLFARQIEGLGRPGDVAWGISTSGSSANVLNGLRRARERGLRTLGLTGAEGGTMAEHCDVVMTVPLRQTPRIQEAHLVTYHVICGALEERLFGARSGS